MRIVWVFPSWGSIPILTAFFCTGRQSFRPPSGDSLRSPDEPLSPAGCSKILLSSRSMVFGSSHPTPQSSRTDAPIACNWAE